MVKSKRSRRKSKPEKPAKPYPDFPLFPHANKSWAKKIRGHMCYFGPWDDPQGALDRFLAQKDDLLAGRRPRVERKGFMVRDACNHFLNAKRHLLDTRELAQRTLLDYKDATDRLVEGFGAHRLVEDLRPDDFASLRVRLAKGVGPARLRDLIVRIKSVFRYAYENELIDKPVRFGQAFKPPSQKSFRRVRNLKGPRMFEAAEIREMVNGTLVVGKQGPELACAGAALRAMILLGINCGFGNADCGRLPLSALDLDRGWVTFPRPKTEIARRCPLWPETVQAIREWLPQRPEPKSAQFAGLVFITFRRGSWAKDVGDNPVSKEMRKLLDALDMNGNRNFYALRHTFETIGGETERQAAVDFIMGHAPRSDDMSAVYRERIGDDRLRAVTDHVRAWLFGKDGGDRRGGGAKEGQEEE